MARILFLVHRIPYPPNKGDKIRSWHFLQSLFARHEVHLGFFVDAKDDLKHLDFLREQSTSMEYCFASPMKQKIASLAGFLRGTSLTENAYPSKKMRCFAAHLIDNKLVDAVFLFSAATYNFLPKNLNGIPIITDFVDVDSAKWEAYADTNTWPASAIFKREAVKLSTFETEVARNSAASILVSGDEASLMSRRLEKQKLTGLNILGITNGVDSEMFSPNRYAVTANEEQLIFTGAMDYAPNVEAVVWFVENVFQRLKSSHPNMEFVIAGRPVAASVQKLDSYDGVKVIGAVDDMAETIAKSTIVVAPLLTARGIQNKVLEGMAMAKPVVATSAANEGINAPDREAVWIADDADAFVNAVETLLDQDEADRLGKAAREFVTRNFNWDVSCSRLEALINDAIAQETMSDSGDAV